MVRFTTAPVEDVAPRRKQRSPSPRSQVAQQYRDALQDALTSGEQALVVELESSDKPLTIRNRIKRAAQQLGRDDVVVRRRGNKIVAYSDPSGEAGVD
jgi:hypothetical protein